MTFWGVKDQEVNIVGFILNISKQMEAKGQLTLYFWPKFYLYDIGPDLDTANLGNGLGPVLLDVEPSTNFTLRLEP